MSYHQHLKNHTNPWFCKFSFIHPQLVTLLGFLSFDSPSDYTEFHLSDLLLILYDAWHRQSITIVLITKSDTVYIKSFTNEMERSKDCFLEFQFSILFFQNHFHFVFIFVEQLLYFHIWTGKNMVPVLHQGLVDRIQMRGLIFLSPDSFGASILVVQELCIDPLLPWFHLFPGQSRFLLSICILGTKGDFFSLPNTLKFKAYSD